MRTTNIAFFVTTLFATLITTPLYAAEELIFSAIENSDNTLISGEVITEAYRRIGIEMEIKEYPGTRALHFSNQGKTDGELFRISGINVNHPNLLMVSVPINRLEGVVYAKKTEFQINGWDSLRPYKIGIRRGIKFTQSGSEGMNVQTVPSDESLFEILDQGRVDVIVLARLNGLRAMQKMKLTDTRALEPPVESYPLYHYLHKKNGYLIPKLTAALQEMEKEGLMQKIREEYIAEHYSVSSDE